eukprot:4978065-Prymnesium_polylepis.1
MRCRACHRRGAATRAARTARRTRRAAYPPCRASGWCCGARRTSVARSSPSSPARAPARVRSWRRRRRRLGGGSSKRRRRRR